ncbi:MAG: hypothetical protein ABSD88_08070 [Candidatus Korobacteraceae bacterium]|jgi:hypothetical protein
MANTEDLIRRAFVNLKSLRENLGSGYVHEESFFQMFNKALDKLQQAGEDVSEWRMPHNAVGNIDAGEFRAKIDALLMYFKVRQTKAQIGFHQ